MSLDEVWSAAQKAAPFLIALLIATTTLSHVLQSAAQALERYAATTKATWDDKLARRLVRFANGLVSVCDFLVRILPRLTTQARVPDASSSDSDRLPPPPRVPPGLALLVIAIVGSLTMHGCGASAIGTQARIASTVSIATRTAGDSIDAARTRALDDVEHRTEGRAPDVRIAALELEAAHWRPVGQALDAVRDLLRTWASAIALAHAAGGDASLLPPIGETVARAVQLYARIAALARELGADVPELPAEVLALATAVAGGA